MLIVQGGPVRVLVSAEAFGVPHKHCEDIASLKGRPRLPQKELVTIEAVYATEVGHFFLKRRKAIAPRDPLEVVVLGKP
jgi:hypothetical protein